ncbi:MAG: ABC transporter ATP-binding protein [Bosea sp.]|uniref:ABC transporter ATP-binding protein n=1 Tax=unclassified Bosea (in: a-proteobacteria) TaxID=2653178 RepID=UPI00096615F1|nr:MULTISPECIES: ABC transporter ATP-binding protein [unclassified Bosea (in: a-proteobacteria)]MBN9455315.1 ABC transporter ATP-binding protein [Bosea sp. (in: a-proteobacteria)]OJV04935.1 MAG: mannosyltransferase [Bosea sp. 67-29]
MSATDAAGGPVVELINVSRRFITPDGKSMTAIRDFNMSVARGEFVAVVGPTGCGKSTTLNLVTGLARPSSGEVRLFGQPVTDIDPRIGFAFQTDALFPWRSVIDNVVAGPLFRGKPRDEAYAKAREWLARVHLSGHETKYPHQLSGGMRKRVSLAQTFINEPQVLLMDEPFSALDVQTRVVMHEVLLNLWSEAKASVIFVTHDLEEAIALADKVYVLTSGPATVKAIYPVELPRPRIVGEIRYQEDFIALSRRIWDDLRAEVERGSARDEAVAA